MIRSSSSYHKEIDYNTDNSRKCDTEYTISANYCTVPVVELPPKCLQLILPLENDIRFYKIDNKYSHRGSISFLWQFHQRKS